jgi:hypothetical protein
MSDYMHVEERCSCGALIEMSGPCIDIRTELQRWRANHRHDLAVFAPAEEVQGDE